jgi:hypothetical protein
MGIEDYDDDDRIAQDANYQPPMFMASDITTYYRM